MNRSSIIFILALNLCLIKVVYSQGSAGENAIYDSRFIVEMPTAGVIPKGTFSFNIGLYKHGGILTDFNVAPFENFNMGMSFSGTRIIGDESPIFQNLPGLSLRFRVFDETTYIPAILIGISTQGRGEWLNDRKRFETLSPGIFISLSKSYRWILGYIALHGGIGYSLEGNNNPNFWLGFEHSVGKIVSFNLEYNANIDEDLGIVMKSKGLLNVCFRVSISKGITLELQVKDILENTKISKGFERSLWFEFIRSF